MTAALGVESLDGGYGNLRVFRNVSFRLEPGRTVGLLGANGAGKTTLLKTIVGALPAAAGRVLFRGDDITGWPAHRRARAGLALVPEGRQILGTLSVRDNLELTRSAERGRPDLEAYADRLAEIYELFPRLHEREGQLGGSLSGGEQQMLAIARALLIKPSVLMLDEPTQGLAPVVIRDLNDKLAHLRGRFAMIVVEQNKAFLEGLADHILTMKSGTLQAS